MKTFRLYFLFTFGGVGLARAVTITARDASHARRLLKEEFPGVTPLRVELVPDPCPLTPVA